MIMTFPALAAVAATLLAGGAPSQFPLAQTATAYRPTDKSAPTVAYWTPERMRAAAGAADTRGGPGPDRNQGSDPVDGTAWTGSVEQVRHIGRLFMLEPGGTPASCTAAVVDSPAGDVIATAAHCVHERAAGGWMRRIVFVPGYRDASAPYGVYAVTSVSAGHGWLNREDPAADFAFLSVAPDSTGQAVQARVGARPAVFQPAAGDKSAFGYPAVGPYDGERLQYCKGGTRIVRDVLLSGGEELRCRMTGGASGGPWYDSLDRQGGVTSGRPDEPRYQGLVWAAVFNDQARKLYEREAAD